MKKVAALLVLLALCAGGYFWWRSTRAAKVEQKPAAVETVARGESARPSPRPARWSPTSTSRSSARRAARS